MCVDGDWQKVKKGRGGERKKRVNPCQPSILNTSQGRGAIIMVIFVHEKAHGPHPFHIGLRGRVLIDRIREGPGRWEHNNIRFKKTLVLNISLQPKVVNPYDTNMPAYVRFNGTLLLFIFNSGKNTS